MGALFAVAVVGVWSALGFNLILLSAGMKGITPEMYEGAELDGASRWRQFTSITVPLLTPSLFFVVVISVVNGFQVFDLFYAMMGTANPVMPRTQPVVYYFFTNISSGNNGYAAAIGLLMLVLVSLFTAIQFRLQRRWVHYA
ncbi:carbohydrate ABC transporter permease [Propionibacteriaceae bacterium Y1685]